MGNEVEMDEKYTPYNHKGTKIDGVEPTFTYSEQFPQID